MAFIGLISSPPSASVFAHVKICLYINKKFIYSNQIMPQLGSVDIKIKLCVAIKENPEIKQYSDLSEELRFAIENTLLPEIVFKGLEAIKEYLNQFHPGYYDIPIDSISSST